MLTTRNLTARRLILLLAFLLLIGVHLGAAFFLRHHELTISMVTGVFVIMAVKHLGFFGPAYALFHRRSRE